MVLIAATALGLAWAAQGWSRLESATRGPTWSWNWIRDTGILVLATSLPCLLAWTAALALLRIRSPRPSWRRASRQPGMTANLAASLASLALLPSVATLILVRYYRNAGSTTNLWRDLMAGLIEFLAMVTPIVGFVVLIAWILLAIQRQWRCERSWIDRSGRVLGALWIVSGSILGTVFIMRLTF
jgi:hypothetical protein